MEAIEVIPALVPKRVIDELVEPGIRLVGANKFLATLNKVA